MKTKEFSFDLPEELIAQTPVQRRGTDRLLLLDRRNGSWADKRMEDFPSLIEEHALLVVNDSKVRKARVHGESEHGGLVEFLFLVELEDGGWTAMVSKSKKQRPGKRFTFSDASGTSSWEAEITGIGEQGERIVRFNQPINESFFDRCGHVPLPPYIKRDDTFEDENRYQTVYAAHSGSVAAPTAGLHFTAPIMENMKERGIELAAITLHVGPGTFLPVRSEFLEDHVMHYERYTITEPVARAVTAAKRDGRPVVAVGTTSVRTLEAAWDRERNMLPAIESKTNLFIRPPYDFAVVDRLLTNFHTPESTLLVLVSTFASRQLILDAYQHAVQERYRFFSYGDAMYII